jgi:hypothetical protein
MQCRVMIFDPSWIGKSSSGIPDTALAVQLRSNDVQAA